MDRGSEPGPGTVRVNGEPCALAGRPLDELLRDLGYATDRPGLAVAVNGEIVRRSAWSEHGLHDGDEIDVVGAVQGG